MPVHSSVPATVDTLVMDSHVLMMMSALTVTTTTVVLLLHARTFQVHSSVLAIVVTKVMVLPATTLTSVILVLTTAAMTAHVKILLVHSNAHVMMDTQVTASLVMTLTNAMIAHAHQTEPVPTQLVHSLAHAIQVTVETDSLVTTMMSVPMMSHAMLMPDVTILMAPLFAHATPAGNQVTAVSLVPTSMNAPLVLTTVTILLLLVTTFKVASSVLASPDTSVTALSVTTRTSAVILTNLERETYPTTR